ncbi:DUF6236 family protein [Streptomyces sp. NPDC053431]|uniref:DUF6236 family protein n=1 Tax=Streptomyces sp. NPDC053431 TaxID=3365703 RepID=UPI0037D5605A
MQRIGLYYPYIHCRDERWLKLTALYWPKLARVVPDGYPVADSDTVAALDDGLGGFLQPTSPGAAAEAVAPLFLELLREHGVALRAIHGISETQRAHGYRVMAEASAPAVGMRTRVAQRRLGLAALHEDEVAPALRNALLEHRLAFATARTHPPYRYGIPWLAMSPRLAWLYKCVLTDELARRTRFAPLTDQSVSHAVHGWDAGLVARALLDLGDHTPPSPAESLEQAVGLLSLRLVVPENLDAVPVEKIVRLRTRHRAEFDAFTNAVSTVTKNLRESLGSIDDPDALRQYLELAIAQSFETPLADLRKSMNFLGITTTFGAMNSKFELGTATALLLGGIPAGQPLVMASGAVLGLAALRHSTARARDAQLRTTPTAYLLRVEKDLRPRQLHKRVTRGLGRIAGTSI